MLITTKMDEGKQEMGFSCVVFLNEYRHQRLLEIPGNPDLVRYWSGMLWNMKASLEMLIPMRKIYKAGGLGVQWND